MRALETEVSRLREAFTNEIADANLQIQQQKEVIHTARDENEILKEILIANGIQFEPELERRRAERASLGGYQSSPVAGSSNGSNTAGFSNSVTNQNTTPGTSISTGMSPRATGIDHPDVSPAMSFPSQQQVYHSGGGEQPMGFDKSACHPTDTPAPALAKGVFETDPQLQIDFILTYVISILPKGESIEEKNIHFTNNPRSTDWKDHVANTQTIFVDGR